MGSLYIDDNVWRMIAPTGAGPQPWGTGREISIWESTDKGATWKKVRDVTSSSEFNHHYVRRPVHTRDPFYAFWANGNPEEMSPLRLFFTSSNGDKVWKLPYQMDNEYAQPRLWESP